MTPTETARALLLADGWTAEEIEDSRTVIPERRTRDERYAIVLFDVLAENDDYRAGADAEAAEADRLRARVAELESWNAELRTHDASLIKAQARGFEAGVRAAADLFTVTEPREARDILALLEPKL